MHPSWHPDPTGRHELRYWDGSTWTDHVADQGVQSMDPLMPQASPTPQVEAERYEPSHQAVAAAEPTLDPAAMSSYQSGAAAEQAQEASGSSPYGDVTRIAATPAPEIAETAETADSPDSSVDPDSPDNPDSPEDLETAEPPADEVGEQP